ncbi:MAG: alpha/beta hydrolase [Eubacteriales bacterium]|nr:alpha/beta hydrolase [Eubacteriales bacterium]
MNHQNHKKSAGKRILLILLALCILTGVLTVAVGNYFVNFAILRQDSFNEDIEPADSLSGEDQAIINASRTAYETFREDVFSDPAIGKEVVTITSDDGLRLEADRYMQAGEREHQWVIFVHGYSSSRTASSSQEIVSVYLSRGYQVLSPDNRGHGGSEGQYIGMGWLDRLDIVKWIDYLTSLDPQAEIYLHGVSMGGATVMMTSGEALPEQVKAIVEDSGYTSVWDEFASELRYLYHLPAFPALYMADVMAGVRAGYHFKEASSLRQLAKCRVPMLFIHGDKDNFVPFEMVYENYDACASADKKLLTVGGAGHVESYLREPELYWSTVFDFLD